MCPRPAGPSASIVAAITTLPGIVGVFLLAGMSDLAARRVQRPEMLDPAAVLGLLRLGPQQVRAADHDPLHPRPRDRDVQPDRLVLSSRQHPFCPPRQRKVSTPKQAPTPSGPEMDKSPADGFTKR